MFLIYLCKQFFPVFYKVIANIYDYSEWEVKKVPQTLANLLTTNSLICLNRFYNLISLQRMTARETFLFEFCRDGVFNCNCTISNKFLTCTSTQLMVGQMLVKTIVVCRILYRIWEKVFLKIIKKYENIVNYSTQNFYPNYSFIKPLETKLEKTFFENY